MRKNSIYFFFGIIGLFAIGKSGAIASDGFFVEIINEQSTDESVKLFIDFERIKIHAPDSAITTSKTKARDVTWIGTNLCQFLQNELDVSCADIQKISVSAPDGYTSVLTGELLSALKTGIFAFRIRGEKDWPESFGYMRLIFPELRSMYWVNGPEKISITIGEISQPTDRTFRFYCLNNPRFNSIKKTDFEGNSYFVVADLFDALGLANGSFKIMTSDGLFREYPAHDIIQHIVFQRENEGTWNLTGVSVPGGLKSRHVFFLLSQNVGIFLCDLTSSQQSLWMNQFWKKEMGAAHSLSISKKMSNGMIEIIPLEAGEWNELNIYKMFESEIHKQGTIEYFIVN